MKISSTRLGELEVVQEQIFFFPKGLPGFPGERKFAFLPEEDESEDKPMFAYLQSISNPALTFILVDPFAFFPAYELVIDDNTELVLGISGNNVPMIWTIATVKDEIKDMTVNLLAPLLFNINENIAGQMILDDSRYTTKHKVFSAEEVLLETEGGEDASTES